MFKINKDFKRGILVGITSTVFLILCVGIVLSFTGDLQVDFSNKDSSTKKIESKAEYIYSYIKEFYLDKVDENEVADSIYKGLVKGLGDDYAEYYNKKEYKEIKESTDGEFCGIGATIAMDEKSGLVKIVEPMDDSPAKKAGIRANDLIYKVDDKITKGMDLSQVQALVKGKQNSKVKIEVLRGKEKKTFEVIRDEIVTKTVYSEMLAGKVGYIRVSQFGKVTVDQFSDAVDKLEKEGQKSMIVDLRDNGGGLLTTAVSMLDKLLPKGLLVYSKDKSGKKQKYMAENDDKFSKPLVVLVNGNSASASEIFSGALQDDEAAVLVGEKTFGKGIVQSVFDLGDGSGLKFTTSKYYTPKGRNIHGKGLQPDVKCKLNKKVYTLPDKKTKVDNQLYEAYKYLTK